MPEVVWLEGLAKCILIIPLNLVEKCFSFFFHFLCCNNFMYIHVCIFGCLSADHSVILCVPLIAFQLIIDSPVSPATSIAPLVFVVTVTAIKQVRIQVLQLRSISHNRSLIDISDIRIARGELLNVAGVGVGLLGVTSKCEEMYYM